jgi:VWFA-related protein
MIRALIALPLAAALSASQFRASVDVVRIDALVLQNARPVAGLTAADFVVTDNGVLQAVAVRPLERQAIDAVVALDTSDSVRGPALDRLRAAAEVLVAQLTPEDRATLATFNHIVTLGPREVGPGAIRPSLRALDADGGTALFDAVTSTLSWAVGRDRPLLLLVFSDGRDTASWTRSDQALALARTSHAVVDAIVAGNLLPTGTRRIGRDGFLDRPTADERILPDLAALTGGRVRHVDAGGDLSKAFRDALEQFRARYEITYTATDKAPGWHGIDVKVKGRRGATVHARRGYQR